MCYIASVGEVYCNPGIERVMEKLRYSNVRESAPLLRSHMEFHSYMCSVMAIFPTRITGVK